MHCVRPDGHMAHAWERPLTHDASSPAICTRYMGIGAVTLACLHGTCITSLHAPRPYKGSAETIYFISAVMLCTCCVALQGLQQELGVDEGADEAGDVASALQADPAPHADAVLQVISALPFQPAGRADDGDQQRAAPLAG